MREVHRGLFVGRESDCFVDREGWAVVHACKYPCHVNAVGYSGSLPREHPNYLYLSSGTNLFLNLIDPPVPLFMPESFSRALDFMAEQAGEGRKILIHCNQGESRSPSLALLFLAKKIGAIPEVSYESAVADYRELDPYYQPGNGIRAFLSAHWAELAFGKR